LGLRFAKTAAFKVAGKTFLVSGLCGRASGQHHHKAENEGKEVDGQRGESASQKSTAKPRQIHVSLR
jgi:hypothetical protein